MDLTVFRVDIAFVIVYKVVACVAYPVKVEAESGVLHAGLQSHDREITSNLVDETCHARESEL